MKMTKRTVGISMVAVSLTVMVLTLSMSQSSEAAGQSTGVPRVNLPYNVPVSQRAIFWFGKLYMESNHANVRMGYDDNALIVHVHTSDRRLWFDTSPTAAELTEWDAISLYLDPAAGGTRYRFVGQLTANGDSQGVYQATYRDDGAGWQSAALPITVETGWRGAGVNDDVGDRGWWIKFEIPFSALGLAGPPASGTSWRAAIEMHDRESAGGPPLLLQTWPVAMDSAQSSSWAELHFGLPVYSPPPSIAQGQVTLRHGVNGVVVSDAHVGGHSTCGKSIPFWAAWGDTNYAGYEQLNIQNQWDIADGPCYSKYYVTFPLDTIPAGAEVIISATLTMYQFGSAGQDVNPPPPPSYLQVLTIDEPWDEQTITWNNAPAAVENYSGTWVEPFTSGDLWPGRPVEWDVSRAVAEAHAAGRPLQLVLYSADTAYHSGRYFYSSDADEPGRPMLDITWGTLSKGANKHFLPLLFGN